MNQTRFSRRMGEHFPYGAEYGCAITKYAKTRMTLADKVLYALAPLCVLAALIFNNYY